MDREKLFDTYFRECRVEGHEQFCGQGEKNSDILIVGKESTQVTVVENHNLCEREKGCGKTRRIEERINTWDNYQKLVDLIYEGYKSTAPKGEWDLEHFVFTTELNKRPSKRTSNPDKEKRDVFEERLSLFRESPFIQTFPVVILACSNYIVNQGVGEERQIDTTFGVKYYPHKETPAWFTPYNWFYIHRGEYTYHGETINKLVIHTRNLSQNLKRELLPSMAQVIKEHLNIKRYERRN